MYRVPDIFSRGIAMTFRILGLILALWAGNATAKWSTDSRESRRIAEGLGRVDASGRSAKQVGSGTSTLVKASIRKVASLAHEKSTVLVRNLDRGLR